MILRGDARHLPLTDRSVHCVVTSPPYWGLRDYRLPPLVWGGLRGSAWCGSLGLEPTPELYVAHLVEVMREVWRVLRDDGTLWLNLGDSYNSGRDGGWPGGKNGMSRPEIAPQRSGVNAPGLKPKDLVGIPWRVAFALQADGWYLRSDIIWSKPNPMPESVTDRPTKAHEYLFLLAKAERYYYDHSAILEPVKMESLERARYAPSSYAETVHNLNGRRAANGTQTNVEGRNRRSVWTIATQPYPEAHFATFPEDLVKPCVLAGCPPGGLVLDPFAGSGTVVKVAQDLGRPGLGVELSPSYTALAWTRSAQLGLV